VTASQWVEQFATEAGAEPPSEEDFAAILELAAVAAHASERIAAPVACWIAGRSGKPPGELLEIAGRVDVEAE
jgi:Domain of unknown function (DUF6457)